VTCAAVRTFAVYDHAAGEHKPTTKLRGRELLQQGRGPEGVDACVRGDIADVFPETDHCGLVADAVHAAERRADGITIRDIRLDHLCGGIEVVRADGARARSQRVEHPDVVMLLEQCVDDVRPDKARATGNEDQHGLSP
jgi:hypothetical protein